MKMKRISKVLIFLLVLTLFNTLGTAKTSATNYTYAADPNYPSQKIYFQTYREHGMLCQIFTPTSSLIANYFDLMVDGTTRNPDLFKVELRGSTPDDFLFAELLGEYRATVMGAKPTGYTDSLQMTRFTNSGVSDNTVDTSKKYWLCLSGSESYNYDTHGDIGWYSDMAGYAGGKARVLGPPLMDPVLEGVPSEEHDFGFAVYNKIAQADQPPADQPVVTPAQTSTSGTPAASTPQPTGVTAGSGAAPANPTASIKAPTELVAADVLADQGGAVKLDWKASSTTDITGYKIFRSLEEKKDFGEIAKTTDKAILTYTDNAAAIGQKYYYIVRAYKDAKESASSNTVNAVSVDNLAPAAPKNFTYAKSALDYVFAWDKNAETDLAGYSLLISDSTGKVLKTIEIAKDANTYELIVGDQPELKTEVAYQFALIAKDLNSNSSEKTTAIEKSQKAAEPASINGAKKSSPLIWYLSAAIILLLAGGGLYWFKFRKKKPSPIS